MKLTLTGCSLVAVVQLSAAWRPVDSRVMCLPPVRVWMVLSDVCVAGPGFTGDGSECTGELSL